MKYNYFIFNQSKFQRMNITFEELRQIKHRLPTGSISKMAKELNIEEQTVRNYFGASKFNSGQIVGKHMRPGPNGGYVNLENSEVIDLARKMIKNHEMEALVN